MKNITQFLPYIFMSGWTIFSIYYIIRARRRPDNINIYILESIPQIFATIGILGTFMGIAYGLSSFNVKKIEDSIPELLDGLRTAFYASIAGIVLLIISSKFVAFAQRKYEKTVVNDETIALNKVIELLTEMKDDLNKNFEFTNEINKKLDAVNSFSDLGSEISELNNSLKKLSNDLALTIDAGFENLIVQQEKNNTVPYLQMLQLELQGLSIKMDNLNEAITESVAKDLASKFEEIINDFKSSITDAAKKELENIIAYLRQAGSTLADFPVKFQVMSESLNQNFTNLQEMLQKTTKETLSQTNESTSIMRKQIEEMNEIVKYFYTIYS